MHIVFLGGFVCRIPVVLESHAVISGGGGRGCALPAPSPSISVSALARLTGSTVGVNLPEAYLILCAQVKRQLIVDTKRIRKTSMSTGIPLPKTSNVSNGNTR